MNTDVVVSFKSSCCIVSIVTDVIPSMFDLPNTRELLMLGHHQFSFYSGIDVKFIGGSFSWQLHSEYIVRCIWFDTNVTIAKHVRLNIYSVPKESTVRYDLTFARQDQVLIHYENRALLYSLIDLYHNNIIKWKRFGGNDTKTISDRNSMMSIWAQNFAAWWGI